MCLSNVLFMFTYYITCFNLHVHHSTTYPFYIFKGVGTKIDPTLCRADRLVGQVLGAVGALPDIFTELEISYFLLRRLLGVRTEGDKKGAKVGVVTSHMTLNQLYVTSHMILNCL